jgi:hypothetical protein
MKNSQEHKRLKDLADITLAGESEPQDAPRPVSIPKWRRKAVNVGEIHYVLRRGWKGVEGFSETRDGHPGLVTVKARKGAPLMEVIPGTSRPDSVNRVLYFKPTPGTVTYHKKVFRKKHSAYVLDYWRPISRKESPYIIGTLNNEDVDRLQCEMVSAHGNEYVEKAI